MWPFSTEDEEESDAEEESETVERTYWTVEWEERQEIEIVTEKFTFVSGDSVTVSHVPKRQPMYADKYEDLFDFDGNVVAVFLHGANIVGENDDVLYINGENVVTREVVERDTTIEYADKRETGLLNEVVADAPFPTDDGVRNMEVSRETREVEVEA